jgi:mannosyl-oligosaccharide glucosidase
MAAVIFRVLTAFSAVASLASGARAQEDAASVLTSEIARQNNQSLLWGPYRPNLYFGVRPRIPKSLMTALLWANVDQYNEIHNSEPCP